MAVIAPAALAPDAVFTRRDELLDESAMRTRLSALLGTGIQRCERVRTTYHPGRNLRVLFHADGALVSARMFGPGTSTSRFQRARAVAGSAVHHDEELATLFFVFPADRKLGALPRLDPAHWPSIPGVDPVSFRLVAYAPERAATAAVIDTDDRTVAFVKLHADTAALRTVAVHHALRARGLRVPAVLASWPELGALAVEPLHGTQLAACDNTSGWRAFGAALARLHAFEPVDEQRSKRLEGSAAATIAALRPDVASSAFELEHALGDAVSVRRGSLVCLHGDVHPKNVVIDGDDAGLVDLDDVAGGHAAADLGSAVAGIRVDTLFGRRDAECADALIDG
jgi:aminoglycoside phosphotransferase